MSKKIIPVLSIALVVVSIVLISLVTYTASNRSPNGLRFSDNLQLVQAQEQAVKANKEKVFAEEAFAAFESDAKKFKGADVCSINDALGVKYSSDYKERLTFAARIGQATCTWASSLAAEAAAVAKDHVTFKSNTAANANTDLAKAQSDHVAATAKIASLELANVALAAAGILAGLIGLGLIAAIIIGRKRQ